MGNSTSNEISKNNVEISKNEYIKYKNYLKEKEIKKEEKKNDNINKIDNNEKIKKTIEIDKIYYKKKKDYNDQQKDKNLINNKISDYQLNSGGSLRSQFIPVIGDATSIQRKDYLENNNLIYQNELNSRLYNTKPLNDTYIPRMNIEINNRKESIGDVEKKFKELNNNRNINAEEFNRKSFNTNLEKSKEENVKKKVNFNLDNTSQINLKNETMIDYEKLDPFNILKKKNISLDDLKIVYRKLCLIHHPDKGGSLENFEKLMNAYNYIENIIELRKMDKTHDELKKTYNESYKNESSRINSKLKVIGSEDNFNLKKFNSVFDETRLKTSNDEGYSSLMKPSSKVREDIEITNNVGKFTPENFKKNFEKEKAKISESVIRYKPPEAIDISNMSYAVLGEEDISNYSNKINNLNLTDYKEAHIDINLLDTNNIKYKEYKNVEEIEKDREIIDLSEEQRNAIDEYEESKKKKEWKRINKLLEDDRNIEKNYNLTNRLYIS